MKQDRTSTLRAKRSRNGAVSKPGRNLSKTSRISRSQIARTFTRAAVGLRHSRAQTRRILPAQPLKFRWADTIAAEDWEVYRTAIRTLRAAEIPFMLGGGFALATFTGRWRDTKDIDFYIHAYDAQAAVTALTRAGFADYYAQRAYDRKWIYRSTRSGVIVDIIWSMANQRAQVDDLWFHHTAPILIRGEKLQVVPLEEFLWCKLYIIQRDHCDWTDVFNLLYAAGPRLDWMRLIQRLEEDVPLLKSLLGAYSWLCPRAARKLPAALWRRLRMPVAAGVAVTQKRDHIRLLDSRSWFAALQPDTAKLEI